MARWILVICLLGAPAVAQAGGVVWQRDGRVEVDWTRGELRAVGVAAADLRMPTVDVARVGAERAARRNARQKLLETAMALPLAGGGTLGEALSTDKKGERLLNKIIDGAEDVDVHYASDGSAEVTLRIPLWEIRRAVVPSDPPLKAPAPVVEPTPPPALRPTLLVDARRKRVSPMVGVAVAAGGQRYVGPAVWYSNPADAKEGTRPGGRLERARVRAVENGALILDLKEGELAALARERPLVVIVIRERR